MVPSSLHVQPLPGSTIVTATHTLGQRRAESIRLSGAGTGGRREWGSGRCEHSTREKRCDGVHRPRTHGEGLPLEQGVEGLRGGGGT